MDTHDAKKRSLEEQARLLAELGFDGAGHVGLDHLAERLRTLDAHGLELFQVYLRVDLSPQAREPYDPRLPGALKLLAGRRTMLALIVGGAPPSETSQDPRAVALVREIAALAARSGLRVALYPHRGDWLERVEDAVRMARQVKRADVGVMFNLCHWLAVDEEANLRPLLQAARPYLLAVSIHGADRAAEIRSGEGQWIQPLGSGSFAIRELLAALRALDYRGPVGLQCYGIAGDAREHLSRSMAAWKRLRAELEPPAKR